ncbi:hypothetical protein MO973_19025 [Paenibacillus sp. TRM 82003]|nr:hypothetical protein [Paenibacillus sp. TRM 82003]
MYNDFLQIKSLEGELKLSHKKRDFGITVSTKELVYQKPHVNYIVRLEDIVTVTPFRPEDEAGFRLARKGVPTYEWGALETTVHHHRVYAKAATMHSRSGIFPLGPTEFILPMMPELLRVVARYASLESF